MSSRFDSKMKGEKMVLGWLPWRKNRRKIDEVEEEHEERMEIYERTINGLLDNIGNFSAEIYRMRTEEGIEKYSVDDEGNLTREGD